MGKTGTVKHTHQYYRRSNGLWHCSGYEECTHYVPKNMPEPTGRKSLCWNCEKPFQLTPVNMRENKPRCDECLDVIEKLAALMEGKNKVAQSNMTSTQRALSSFPQKNPPKPQVEESDEIEIIEPEEN